MRGLGYSPNRMASGRYHPGRMRDERGQRVRIRTEADGGDAEVLLQQKVEQRFSGVLAAHLGYVGNQLAIVYLILGLSEVGEPIIF